MNILDHGTLDIKIQCNYCGKVMNGYYRLKYHLGGVQKDVESCEKVPTRVKEQYRSILRESRRGNLAKEVGNMYQPDLPRMLGKRPLDLNGAKSIKSEDGKSPAAQTDNLAHMRSILEDSVTEEIPSHNTRDGCRIAAANGDVEDMSARQAQKSIGRFFYETGIDLSVVNSPSFRTMINAMSGIGQRKYNIPTVKDLKGWILQDEVKEMLGYIEKVKYSWRSNGCTILLDEWTDEKGRNLVIFIAECPEGAIYLGSTDVSAIISDVNALQRLLDGVIQEVGVDNAVQIVVCSTTGWVGDVGRQFMEKCPTVFWCVSAPHCIGLMLEKIGSVDSIRVILDNTKILTTFINENAKVLKRMIDDTCDFDLFKPSKLKWAEPFLTLENIVSKKEKLKDMFASHLWRSSICAYSPEGKRVASLVEDQLFWSGAETVLKATTPLLRILCCISDNDKPQVGYIYEAMDQAKEAIKEELKSQYTPFWVVIDEIWDTFLYNPLHAAGYYLNPGLFYAADFHIDPEVAFGLLCCIVRMIQDHHTQDLISLQLDKYRNARGDFEEGSAIDKRNSIPPVQWWSIYGKQCPELQRFAIKILSQTCDGALKYELKRDLAEKLLISGRNCIEQQRLNDLTNLHYNLQMKKKKLRVAEEFFGEEIDPIGIDDGHAADTAIDLVHLPK
ncbi:hypothetical protein K2173_016345 [Erythroxylum novogranatense]|uniref:DUF659 domain-containing protein n=1 Tax=Erythroxylum novogranatense TaxID=1862640 RepID=A0AAV8SG99_9ROSI|nr:hypothetical protein K2173_016345 [Erythroxylum novogranatense]